MMIRYTAQGFIELLYCGPIGANCEDLKGGSIKVTSQ
jgi:hypothetical protein